MNRIRLGFVVGLSTVAAGVFAYLCIPGHLLGTYFYNAAPPLFRQMILWEQSSNALGQQNGQILWGEVQEHLRVSIFAALFAIGLGMPLGVAASRQRHIRAIATNMVGVARAVPGIAVVFLLYPFLGQGEVPGIIALVLLALPPIFLNTVAGYGGVDRSVVESARGMGMNWVQIFLRIETPLAAAVVIAGLRIAFVEILASAAILAFSANVDTLGTQISYFIDNEGSKAYCLPSGCSIFPGHGAVLVRDGESELAAGVALIASFALSAEVLLTLIQRVLAPVRR